jgi:cytochrome c-type biogenesis protein CcmH/NrfF
VLSILIWWAAPVVAATVAAAVIAVARRVRAARGDVETLERYQRAREALARSAKGVAAARARQE